MNQELIHQICDAIGVKYGTVRRIVLDISYGAYPTVYIEEGLEEGKLVNVDWAGNLKPTTIRIANDIKDAVDAQNEYAKRIADYDERVDEEHIKPNDDALQFHHGLLGIVKPGKK